MNVSDFYDFPFHPKVLDYVSFLAYCRLADRQTQCFIEKCNDQNADKIFSPSNFLCTFKRQHFLRARSCLEESEPIGFLRCDRSCQFNEEKQQQKNDIELGKVFVETELELYEKELDTLCTFQNCFSKCHKKIIEQICSPNQANIAIELIQTYIKWHSADLFDWHLLTGNEKLLPQSCALLIQLEKNEQKSLENNNNIKLKEIDDTIDPIVMAIMAAV
ncbi:hypothetical protein Mgra_00002410 [Meloidogyne graminicola]|uniref:Chondroitin proteoglycan 4 domain-containing protein n=1 Tax=Meloidogyne graminicola TaxID=189291 RepID=A0A8S9ZZ63_9BILA|nr:hypothetical protein Mgra_00002410 [Meloidogyne graminicola]